MICIGAKLIAAEPKVLSQGNKKVIDALCSLREHKMYDIFDVNPPCMYIAGDQRSMNATHHWAYVGFEQSAVQSVKAVSQGYGRHDDDASKPTLQSTSICRAPKNLESSRHSKKTTWQEQKYLQQSMIVSKSRLRIIQSRAVVAKDQMCLCTIAMENG